MDAEKEGEGVTDKRLLNNVELALFFSVMRPITIAKGREALDAVHQHIEAQAERIAELEEEDRRWRESAALLQETDKDRFKEHDEEMAVLERKITRQARQIEKLEHAIRSWKHEEELWREQEREMCDELKEARAEMDAIRYAAHMPKDYEHGLPSWINQHLYGELIMLRDADGGPISRSEDLEEIARLRRSLKKERGEMQG